MAYPALATLLTTKQEQLSQHLAALASQLPGTIYAGMSDDQRLQMATTIAENVIAHFAGTQPIEVFGQRMTRMRVHDPAYTPEAIQGIIATIATALFALVDAAYPVGHPEREAAREAVHDLILRDSTICFMTFAADREQALQASVSEQAHLLEVLRAVSTPIIPVSDGVLVVPLVGQMDADRAQALMEDLLTAIGQWQAEQVIIDITGVPLVDTAIANHLLQTTKAVTLLGAQTIVVGIGADVAQTLTSLGLDLRHMSIRANLEAGIQTALAARGLGIGPISRR
jgi:rsbT co-antagonist protein RsbR